MKLVKGVIVYRLGGPVNEPNRMNLRVTKVNDNGTVNLGPISRKVTWITNVPISEIAPEREDYWDRSF